MPVSTNSAGVELCLVSVARASSSLELHTSNGVPRYRPRIGTDLPCSSFDIRLRAGGRTYVNEHPCKGRRKGRGTQMDL